MSRGDALPWRDVDAGVDFAEAELPSQTKRRPKPAIAPRMHTRLNSTTLLFFEYDISSPLAREHGPDSTREELFKSDAKNAQR